MDKFWVQDSVPEEAVDIRGLREHVSQFDTPYVEVNYLKRIKNIHQRWMLYRQPLADIRLFPGSETEEGSCD